MRALRENLVPVAFLAMWLAASGYTLHALRGLRALRAVEGTVTLTITPPPPHHAAATSQDDR
ncbi:MAG TPA: hypothetical protein VG496_14765 [Myxococcales bacterium]|nr:hypothetical protein [Myxococcales bacterium]